MFCCKKCRDLEDKLGRALAEIDNLNQYAEQTDKEHIKEVQRTHQGWQSKYEALMVAFISEKEARQFLCEDLQKTLRIIESSMGAMQ